MAINGREISVGQLIKKWPAGDFRERRNMSTEMTAQSSMSSVAESSSSLAGFFQSISNSAPVDYMQQALINIHDASGLPWWASIVCSTVIMRTFIALPLTIYQQKIMARIELLTLEMPQIVTDLKREAAIAMKKFNWTEKHTRSVYNRSIKQQWNKLIIRDNCHPAKTLIVLWGQIPLWICTSVALRNIVQMLPNPHSLQAQVAFTEMTVGGFGWIPNLIEVDTSYILPVALGLINLAIIEVQTTLRTKPQTRLNVYATNAFRVLSIVMIPVACSVPAALCVYWVTSSTHAFAQNLLLAAPTVRRAVGIPHTQSEMANPYQQLGRKLGMRTATEHVDENRKQQNSKDSTAN